MQAKQIVIAVLAAMGLMSNGVVSGAELGKVWLNSGLDQPLSADIELIVPNVAELKHLHVKMGEEDAFHRAHLDALPVLKTIHFYLHSKPDGSMLVHLSSDQPITTPVLDMLIELDWDTGMMLQQYHLALNSPGMDSGIQQSSNPVVNTTLAATVPAQQSSDANTIPQNRDASTQNPAQPVTAQSIRKMNALTTQTVQVEKGMTLSAIAVQYLPQGVHLDQMLLALYRENAHVFDGNMNRMQAGRILRMPTQHDLAAISEAVAEHEVQTQTEAWHKYRQKLALESRHSTARSPSSSEVHGHLVGVIPEKTVSPGKNMDELKLTHTALLRSAHKGERLIQMQPTVIEKKQMAGDDAVAQKKALKEEKIRAALLEDNARNIQKLLALKKQTLNENKPTSQMAAVKPFPDAVSASPPQSGAVAKKKWYEKLSLSDVLAGGVIVAVLAWLKSIIRHRRQIAPKQKIYPG